jgi:hypothetical protein
MLSGVSSGDSPPPVSFSTRQQLKEEITIYCFLLFKFFFFFSVSLPFLSFLLFSLISSFSPFSTTPLSYIYTYTDTYYRHKDFWDFWMGRRVCFLCCPSDWMVIERAHSTLYCCLHLIPPEHERNRRPPRPGNFKKKWSQVWKKKKKKKKN